MPETCAGCGAQLPAEAEACPYCGRRLQRPEADQTPPAAKRRAWGFEWRTRAELLGWPLVHVAIGRSAKTGRLRVAKGVVAVGQFGVGLITFAQVGVGALLGFGQVLGGYWALAQVALAVRFGVGQLATGLAAVGQLGFGRYVLAQAGVGTYVWSQARCDPEAVQYFTDLWHAVCGLFGG